MGLEKILEYIIQGGPVAIALIMAVIAITMWRKVESLQETIEKMHDEKEAMFREWKEETTSRAERLQSALQNSTVAITTNAANTDAVKISLNSIMVFISGLVGAIPPKGGR